MATKYYRYTLEGEQGADEAQRTLGEEASDGMIVRVDNVGGQTHVYVARQVTAGAKSIATGGKKAAAAGRLKVKEVSESEVRKPL
jgi:hypothetical protein